MPSILEKLAHHEQTIDADRLPIVFCARCGSTYLDQNSITSLLCYDCGNELAWDASKFSIRRGIAPGGQSDVRDGLRLAEKLNHQHAPELERV